MVSCALSTFLGKYVEIAVGLLSRRGGLYKGGSSPDRYEHFVEHIDRMDVLFASSFAKLDDAGRPFTRCGLTRRYLSLIEGPPRRLYNKHTETVNSGHPLLSHSATFADDGGHFYIVGVWL